MARDFVNRCVFHLPAFQIGCWNRYCNAVHERLRKFFFGKCFQCPVKKKKRKKERKTEDLNQAFKISFSDLIN